MSYTLQYNNDEPVVIPEQDSGPVIAVHVCDMYELKEWLVNEIVGAAYIHRDLATCMEYLVRDYTSYLVNLFSYPEDVAFFMMKDLPVLQFQINELYFDAAPYMGSVVSYMVQGYEYLRNVVGIVPGLAFIYKTHDYLDGHFSVTVQHRVTQ